MNIGLQREVKTTTWIFPMAGKGSRTSQLGEFKPFIEICGKKMLRWLLLSIKKNISKTDDLVFITTEYFYEKYAIQRELCQLVQALNISNSVDIVTVKRTPPGPAASVYAAKENFSHENQVIVINCDQYIDFDIPQLEGRKSGFLPIYSNFGEKSSYVEIQQGKIVRIVEKENISNLASAGVYGLGSGKALIAALDNQIKHDIMYKNEYYVGPALNFLIEDNYALYPVEVRAKFDLGNIQGIKNFENLVRNITLA